MATKGFVISRLPGFNPIAGLVFVGLYLPIIILVVYSFNAGRSVAGWEGFSLHWYTVAWENDAVKAATVRSLHAVASTPPEKVFTLVSISAVPERIMIGVLILPTLSVRRTSMPLMSGRFRSSRIRS